MEVYLTEAQVSELKAQGEDLKVLESRSDERARRAAVRAVNNPSPIVEGPRSRSRTRLGKPEWAIAQAAKRTKARKKAKGKAQGTPVKKRSLAVARWKQPTG
jgi:hypothetical protein